jgi:hypothetical protein
MDEKILTDIVMQLAQINITLNRLVERIDGFTTDLSDFSDRFEEVVLQMESERIIDTIGEYN